MSDPIKLTMTFADKSLNGDYVRYEDYARVAADSEQSKRINTELLVLSERQASDIRRLTKAGDAMMDDLISDACENYPSIQAWNAAKEGGQS